jgi:anastral spindle protein 1
LSGIEAIADNLEGDLQKMGLNWAASTLKRTQESQTMQSSSSSGNLSKEIPVFKRTIEIEIDDGLSTPVSSCSDSSGRPLNLKEFLKRELTLKSDNNLTNESSLASPIFPNSSSQGSSSKSSDKNMLRTSTPVEDPKSSRTSTRLEQRQEQTIFPGESLSSVKMSSTESHNES